MHASPFVPGAAKHPSPDRLNAAVTGSGPSPPAIRLSASEFEALTPARPLFPLGAGVPLDDTPPRLVCTLELFLLSIDFSFASGY